MKQLMYQIWPDTDGMWHWVIFSGFAVLAYSFGAFRKRDEAQLDAERHYRRFK